MNKRIGSVDDSAEGGSGCRRDKREHRMASQQKILQRGFAGDPGVFFRRRLDEDGLEGGWWWDGRAEAQGWIGSGGWRRGRKKMNTTTGAGGVYVV